VRVISDTGGQRLDVPLDRNLWDAVDAQGQPMSIASPLDPAQFGVDPLTFM
jgi:hypothetical protein